MSRRRCSAARIKQRIRERTGLTASVGAATNKLVAKIASDLHKPDGLTIVTAQNLRATLDPLPVRRLPGLGGKTGLRLEAAGVRTLGELRVAPDPQLWPIFGRHSQSIRDRAAGIDDRPVMVERQELSISAEDTFDQDIHDRRRLCQAVAELADLACSRTAVTANWRPAASASRSASTISRRSPASGRCSRRPMTGARSRRSPPSCWSCG